MMKVLFAALFGVLLTTIARGGHAEPSYGEYVFKLAGCAGCHTASEPGASPLAGGHRFDTPYGTFYSPNITPHAEDGIGRWSEVDFVRALRDGVAPDGSHYYPVFPFPSYTRMRESDMRALFAYLRGLKPAARPKQEHELAWFARFRFTNWLWKLVFFEPGELRPDAKRSVLWNRGAYIAQAMAHCGECHSPRGLAGGVDRARHLSGNSEGPGGDAVPNITPHVSAEFREWDKIDIGAYLSTGEMPDGDYAGGMMAEVIDEGLTHLTKIDSEALVEYIMALRPLPTKE